MMTPARYVLILLVLVQAALSPANALSFPLFPNSPGIVCSLADMPWYICTPSEAISPEAIPNFYNRVAVFFGAESEEEAAAEEEGGALNRVVGFVSNRGDEDEEEGNGGAEEEAAAEEEGGALNRVVGFVRNRDDEDEEEENGGARRQLRARMHEQ